MSGHLTHKYVDDTTVTETIEKGTVSEMQNAMDKLLEWSELKHININTKKTKEMVMGSYGKENNTLTITTDAVEQVQTFKLLGVVINHTLSWDDHITAITAKAAKRMWFLKKLKRADVSTEDLTYYYQAVIRPVLQYSMLAQPGIPVSQKDKRKHWRMFSTVQFKSSATTSRMKTPVVCSNCAHWQRDVWSSAELCFSR